MQATPNRAKPDGTATMESTPDGTTEIIAVGTVDTRTAGAGTNAIGMIGMTVMTVMSGEIAMVATTVAAVTEAKRQDVLGKELARFAGSF